MGPGDSQGRHDEKVTLCWLVSSSTEVGRTRAGRLSLPTQLVTCSHVSQNLPNHLVMARLSPTTQSRNFYQQLFYNRDPSHLSCTPFPRGKPTCHHLVQICPSIISLSFSYRLSAPMPPQSFSLISAYILRSRFLQKNFFFFSFFFLQNVH